MCLWCSRIRLTKRTVQYTREVAPICIPTWEAVNLRVVYNLSPWGWISASRLNLSHYQNSSDTWCALRNLRYKIHDINIFSVAGQAYYSKIITPYRNFVIWPQNYVASLYHWPFTPTFSIIIIFPSAARFIPDNQRANIHHILPYLLILHVPLYHQFP